MGLFSKKPKEIPFDAADCQNKKAIMRQMFNEAVGEGDSYAILHATETSSKFERGFNTAASYHYILGYRERDDSIVLVQIDRGLARHSDACFLEMDAVVRAGYNPKCTQVCLTYKKGYPPYAEILDIGDTGEKTTHGIANTVQPREREAFLDYLEGLRGRLEKAGHRQEKWKR